MTARLVPGMRVRHPGELNWGVGQVQSAIGDRVTVNFEHAGKRLINCAIIQLDEVAAGSEETDAGQADGSAPPR